MSLFSVVFAQELPEIKLFNKWSTDDVVVNDISLTDYIAVKEKFAKYLPHSAGRYAAKRFRKAQVSLELQMKTSGRMNLRAPKCWYVCLIFAFINSSLSFPLFATQCPIVERLTNSLMMHGRNNGKKLMAIRIVKHAFEIIHLLTGENPLQVC